MTKFFAFILCLFSFVASAGTFTYRLYEDSVREFTPFTFTIEMDGGFKNGSKIKSIFIKDGALVLFSFNEKQIQKVFKFSWNADNTLTMAAGEGEFRAVVKTEVPNGWGDTSINPKDHYSVFMDPAVVLNEQGTINEARFEIPNQTVEETCLWGILKK